MKIGLIVVLVVITLFSVSVSAQEIQYRGFGGVTVINPTGALVWYDSLMRSTVLDDENLFLAYDMSSMNIDSEIYDFSDRDNHGTMYPGNSSYNESSSADSTLEEGSPDSNYGTLTTLLIRSWGPNDRRAFLLWDISSIPSDATIIDAQMVLYKTSDTGSFPRTYDAEKASSSWTENGITWNNQPGVTGSAVSISITTAEGEYNWNITDFVQDWIDGTQTNYGLRIKDQTESSGSQIGSMWSSKEGDNDPYLVIIYIDPDSRISLVTSTFGQARDFDGYDDYVDTGLDISPDNFTLVTWVNGDSFASGDNAKAILSKRGIEWAWYVETDGTIKFIAWDSTPVITVSLTSTLSLSIGQFYGLGLRWNGSVAALWIDGTLSGSASISQGPIDDGAITITIGEQTADPDRYWDGPIDEVLIFTDVKTDLEMSYLTTVREQVVIGGGSASVPQRYAGLILALPWLIVAGIMFTMFYIAFLAWRKSLKGEW